VALVSQDHVDVTRIGEHGRILSDSATAVPACTHIKDTIVLLSVKLCINIAASNMLI
jgi:hypothetical protein